MKILAERLNWLSIRNLFSQKKKFILSVAYLLFLIDLILRFYTQTRDINAKDSWEISEWLINYQGGFVRRGLPGEIILQLYHYVGLSPYAVIMFLCIVSYIGVVVFFIYTFRKNGYSLFLLPFVFFLGNPSINGFWVRKDLILILLFIAVIYFSLRKKNLSVILANLFFIIAILSHEAIGFFCFPVLLLILADKRGNKTELLKSSITSLIKLIPSIVTFFLVLYFKGSWNIATQIWQSWKIIPFPGSENYNPELPAAIGSLSWSLHRGLSLLKRTLTDFYEGIYAPLVWGFVIIMIYYIIVNTNKLKTLVFVKNKTPTNFNKINLSNTLILQFLAVVPLFVLGCDFGRWIFFWISTSFVIYLIVPQERLSVLYPGILTRLSLRFNAILETALPSSQSFFYLVIFLLGFPAATGGPTWIIGIDGFYNSSAAIIILKLISIFIKKNHFIIWWILTTLISSLPNH
jgi:hypothetical protein